MKKEKVKKNKVRPPLRTKFDWFNRFKHWWLGGVGVKHSVFRVKGALQTLLVLVIVVSVGYAMAAFYTNSGEFVISIDKKMANDGFTISENNDFSEKLITLHGDVALGANNIDIADIDRNVMNVDGSHNGINYLAYTFYLKNETGETRDYQYTLRLKKATKGAEKATWIMIFKNNKMNLYAMANSDGNPERIYSETPFAFMEYAEREDLQKKLSDDNPGYITDEEKNALGITDINSLYQLEAIPFISKDAVCSGTREDINAYEVDKYTVVIWFEGADADCIDDIIGGNLQFSMSFTY